MSFIYEMRDNRLTTGVGALGWPSRSTSLVQNWVVTYVQLSYLLKTFILEDNLHFRTIQKQHLAIETYLIFLLEEIVNLFGRYLFKKGMDYVDLVNFF